MWPTSPCVTSIDGFSSARYLQHTSLELWAIDSTCFLLTRCATYSPTNRQWVHCMPRLLRFPPDELTVAPANDRPRLCSYLRIRPRRFLLHQVVSNIPMSGRIPGYFAGYLDADVYGPAITVVPSQAGARHWGRRQWRGHRRRNWKPDYAATVRRTASATHERTVLTLLFRIAKLGYRHALLIYACVNAFFTAIACMLLKVRPPPWQRTAKKRWLPRKVDGRFWSIFMGIMIAQFGYLVSTLPPCRLACLLTERSTFPDQCPFYYITTYTKTVGGIPSGGNALIPVVPLVVINLCGTRLRPPLPCDRAQLRLTLHSGCRSGNLHHRALPRAYADRLHPIHRRLAPASSRIRSAPSMYSSSPSSSVVSCRWSSGPSRPPTRRSSRSAPRTD